MGAGGWMVAGWVLGGWLGGRWVGGAHFSGGLFPSVSSLNSPSSFLAWPLESSPALPVPVAARTPLSLEAKPQLWGLSEASWQQLAGAPSPARTSRAEVAAPSPGRARPEGASHGRARALSPNRGPSDTVQTLPIEYTAQPQAHENRAASSLLPSAERKRAGRESLERPGPSTAPRPSPT